MNNDFSGSSLGWATADTFMGAAGLILGGALISGVYFTGRIGYQIYDEYNNGQ